MWGSASDNRWEISFCVFILLTQIMDKNIGAAYFLCEDRIKHDNHDEKTEREGLENLVRLMDREIFERCKEIFHIRHKTRKGGKESCNPIRDGNVAWRGKQPNSRTEQLVNDVRSVVRDFAIRRQTSSSTDEIPYTDLGRRATIFLGDFL